MAGLLDIVPDVREALEEALIETTQNIATDLRTYGPYWDGTFADNWIALPGDRAIKPFIPTFPNVAKNPRPRPASWQEIDLTPSQNLTGYTLGNRTTYRLYAMDLLPSGVWGGIYRGETRRQTAPLKKFWYEKYINNGLMQRQIGKSVSDVFRRYS